MIAKKKSNLERSIFIGIIFLLLFISYQLYSKNKTPKTEMDCLKLGSNERVNLCLQFLKEGKGFEDFLLSNLNLENISGEDTGLCLKISGTIYNSGSQPATLIGLRADFSKELNGIPFHYEVFSPFQENSEQVQPNSRKSFSSCMNSQTYNAVKNVKWYFSVAPYTAKIFNQ